MIIDGSSGNCDGCKWWNINHYQTGICKLPESTAAKMWSDGEIATVASFACSEYEAS